MATGASLNIGKRIAEIREDAGMSQSALARAVGISQSAISQIEAGDRNPSFEMLRSIAKALGVTPAYLVGPEETGLTRDEQVLFRQYKSLPTSARKELQDFAAYLRAKHAAKRRVDDGGKGSQAE